MKDLSSGTTTIDDDRLNDPLTQPGNASEAELKTMDAIVKELASISSTTASLSAIVSSTGESSLQTANARLASIRDSVSALTDLQRNNNAAQTDMLVTNAAILDSLGGISKAIDHGNDCLDRLCSHGIGMTMKLSGDADVLQSINKFISLLSETAIANAVNKNAANINAALRTVIPSITELAKALRVTDERRADGSSTSQRIDSSLLGSLQSLLQLASDAKLIRAASRNIAVLSDTLEALANCIQSVSGKLAVTETAVKALQSFAGIVADLNRVLPAAAKSVAIIAAVTGGIVAAFTVIDADLMLRTAIGFPLIASGIALGIYAITKATAKIDTAKVHNVAVSMTMLSGAMTLLALLPSGAILKGVTTLLLASTVLAVGLLAVNKIAGNVFADFGKNILYFAGGVATMGLALIAMSYIVEETPWSTLAKGAAALLGTTVMLGIALKLMPVDDIKGFGWSVLALTASLLVLGYALPFFEEQTKNLEPETWLKAGAILLSLTAAIAVINATTKDTDGKTAAINILAIVGALAVMPAILDLYKPIDWADLAKPALVLTALTTAVVLTGKSQKQTYAGTAAIVAMSGALAVLAYALPKFEQISWETFGKLPVALLELGLAMWGIGKVATTATSGAMLLAVGSASIYALAAGLVKFEGVSWETLVKLPIVIVEMGLAMAGLGIVAPAIVLGAAAAATLGAAVYSVASGLAKANSVDFEASSDTADAIVEWASGTCKKLADGLSVKDMIKAELAMAPIYALGSALKNIVDAVIDMANGTYNEYEVGRDGKPRIVAVKHIGQDTYKAFADSLTTMIDGITKPLAKFGEGGGWLSKSDTAKGIDALKDIGSIVQPMIDVATNMEAIEKANFALIGPRFRDFFGVNEDGSFQKNGLVAVLQGIGGDTPWIGDSDLENGIEAMEGIDSIIKPFVDLAKHSEELKQTDFKAFGQSLSDLQPAIASYAKFDETLPDQFKLASNLTSITDAFVSLDKHRNNLELMKDIAVSIDSIANTDISKLRTVKSEASKQLFDKLDTINKQLTKIEDNTSPDNQVSMTDVELDANGMPKQAFQLQAGQHVDIVTIAVQLNQIKNLLAAQRSIPKTK